MRFRTVTRRYESNLSKITRPVAAIKSLRFALFDYILSFFTTLSWYIDHVSYTALWLVAYMDVLGVVTQYYCLV